MKIGYGMSLYEQVNRIKEKILLAKEKDSRFDVFGSTKHKYEWNAPISSEEVQDFENRNNITLPEGFKLFITEIGNGGAGPYYGIYKVATSSHDGYLSKPCKLHPNLSNEEWGHLTSFEDDDNLTDEQYDSHYDALFQGMLRIGTQGCTYDMMLVVSGEYKGRVVYIDGDLQKPFFTYENNFLDWYERWLDEIIQGYEIDWFGMSMGGDDTELMNKFHVSNDEEYKVDTIWGMNKLPCLLPETIRFLEEQCHNDSHAIKSVSLQLLTKNCYTKAKSFLQQWLESDNEDDILTGLKYIYWYVEEDVQDFVKPIKTVLSTTKNPENFRFITYILEKSSEEDASLYVPFFTHPNKEIRTCAIHTVGKSKEKEKYLQDLIQCLQDDEVSVKCTAIQALRDVTNPILLPYYEKILDEYKTNEHYILSNVMYRLEEFGTQAKSILEKAKQHPDKEIKGSAYRMLKEIE